MKENIDRMLFYAHSYTNRTIGMVSTSLVKDLEKLNGMEEGTLDVHRVIGGMKKIGVDQVVSEDMAIGASKKAAQEILEKAEGKVILSNSFAVKNFVETKYPELADRIVYYPSVQESFAKIAADLGKQLGYDTAKMKTVVFTANNENGAEAKECHSVDFSMNAREVYRLFRRTGVELKVEPPVDALKMCTDQKYTDDAVIGPVAFNYDKEPEVIRLQGKVAAVAHNLGQCAKLLDEVKAGTGRYDIIRLCA